MIHKSHKEKFPSSMAPDSTTNLSYYLLSYFWWQSHKMVMLLELYKSSVHEAPNREDVLFPGAANEWQYIIIKLSDQIA